MRDDFRRIAAGIFAMLLPLWFPGAVSAQQTTTTNRTLIEAPEPLVRLSQGRSCTVYPGGDRLGGRGGTVKLGYVVGADGEIANVTLLASSGDALLDGNAIACAKSWKFEPLSTTGATAPFAAQALVTYSFQYNGSTRKATMVWRAPQLKEASDVATVETGKLALLCLRDTSGISALASATGAPTLVRLSFRNGKMSDVVVVASSGIDALDKAAVACYQNVPASEDRARMMARLTDVNFTVRWQELFPPSTATVIYNPSTVH